VIVFSWFLVVLGLFLYSFTQIDLGLTLTRVSFWQPIQRAFQHIGYFQRPLSASIYLILLLMLFIFYLLWLKKIRQREIARKDVWRMILITAVILTFSYNAFSYDLFNYIFDARIVTFYQQNPYQMRALDFPEDSMLGFMHWTHRVYPYGPTWLLLTVPVSFLGSQKFLLTAILFKEMATAGYFLLVFLTEKILLRINPARALLGTAIFAFNPLVVIEGLVSAHNDVLMMALAVAGLFFLIRGKILPAWVLFLLSVGIKFATGFLLPVFLWVTFFPRRIKEDKIWVASAILMALAIVLASRRTELQPWYLLYLWPFVALLPGKRWLFWPATMLSWGLLLIYAPFLYQGNWNWPVLGMKLVIVIVAVGLGWFLGFLKQINLGAGKID
jgi:hypothetical protein